MGIKFIIAQIIGIFALAVLALSFQNDNKTKLMKYQVLSSILYAIQYALLNAYTGVFLNIVCFFRNYIFSKYENKKVPIVWLIIVVILIAMFAIINYFDIMSFLINCGIILLSIALWYGNLTFVRIAEVITCVFFMIYNIKVLAFVSCISTTIELTSTIIAIYRFDIKKLNKAK